MKHACGGLFSGLVYYISITDLINFPSTTKLSAALTTLEVTHHTNEHLLPHSTTVFVEGRA